MIWVGVNRVWSGFAGSAGLHLHTECWVKKVCNVPTARP